MAEPDTTGVVEGSKPDESGVLLADPQVYLLRKSLVSEPTTTTLTQKNIPYLVHSELEVRVKDLIRTRHSDSRWPWKDRTKP